MKTFQRITFLVLFLSSAYLLKAQISLPSIFCDGMVLQQNSQAPFWGQGRAGETIKIIGSWMGTDTIKVKIPSNGRWTTALPIQKAGGSHTLKLIGSNTITLKDILFGEVWLCSGQSNMEWTANSGLVDKDKEISAANYPNIRFFKVANRGADDPQNDCEGEWLSCTPETMRRNSAVAYFFARKLQKEINVPVGLIISAWGGTPAEVWTPQQAIEKNPLLNADKPTKQFEWWPIESGVLYNQMINPIIRYRIAGALWYQGESNIDNYSHYNLLIKTMVGQWRIANQNDFPFYFVQIAPYTYGDTNEKPALLREQQAKTAVELPNAGMIVVNDLVDNIKDIHPIDKQNVGLRLANVALAETYKMPIKGYKSPTYKRMEVRKNELVLHFNDAEQGLKMKGDKIIGLEVTEADGKAILFKAKVVGSTVVVSAKTISATTRVRYCFNSTSIGNVFSVDGNLPVAPFRTDGVPDHQMKLVFSDEFEIDGLPDSSKWTYDIGGHGWGNNEKQYYKKASLPNSYIKDGKLHIVALKESFEGSEYTSAKLTTYKKLALQYGKVEVRAKLPAGKGSWPAIWMLPVSIMDKSEDWPLSGEIDIMEHVGKDPNMVHVSLHSLLYNHIKGTQVTHFERLDDVANSFHKYGIEWTDQSIKFYIDDQLFYESRKGENGRVATNEGWPFDKPYFLILNLAVGGNWGGEIDPTIFPNEMQVDYVRIYQ